MAITKLQSANSTQNLVKINGNDANRYLQRYNRPLKIQQNKKMEKLKKLFEKGYSDEEIGKQLGWKKDTVIHHRSKLRLLRQKENYVTLNPEKLDELLAKITVRNNHMPRWEIAEKINASHRLWRCTMNRKCKGLKKWQFEKLAELADIPLQKAFEVYTL